jgi:hypothetical protein
MEQVLRVDSEYDELAALKNFMRRARSNLFTDDGVAVGVE